MAHADGAGPALPERAGVASQVSVERSSVAYRDPDVGLLLRAGIDATSVTEALPLAREWGVPVHAVLLALGWVDDDSYVDALASSLGPGVATWRGGSYRRETSVVIEATSQTPSEIAARVRAVIAGGTRVVLVPARRIQQIERVSERRARLIEAANGLRRRAPMLSAGLAVPDWQVSVVVAVVGTFIGGLFVAPGLVVTAACAALALPFFCIVALRVMALAAMLIGGNRDVEPVGRIADRDLPSYAVLVPLYREVDVLPALVAALQRLDYPAAKLDIVLVLEASDIESQAAVEFIQLPPNMRVIVVPDALPRTKPKALNFALGYAKGDMVVVYDAEDIPEPDQLRRAVALMRQSPRPVGCVQARLNIDNADEGWLARQFALEYTALFDALLPALSRFGIPVPLGGTSNHFPRAVLEQAGGWDPFNVTEDAELGIRLARRRLAVLVLASTTWEEAPVAFGVWLRQRTRWIKGWMQTWLVHMRDPIRVSRELGPAGFVGLQVLMGGLVLSALMHPIFYVLVGLELLRERPFAAPDGGIGQIMWLIAAFNLAAGYLTGIALGVAASLRRGLVWQSVCALAMPVYWLLISVAAYRALLQLIREPHLWEKTSHGSRRRIVGRRSSSSPSQTPA